MRGGVERARPFASFNDNYDVAECCYDAISQQKVMLVDWRVRLELGDYRTAGFDNLLSQQMVRMRMNIVQAKCSLNSALMIFFIAGIQADTDIYPLCRS